MAALRQAALSLLVVALACAAAPRPVAGKTDSLPRATPAVFEPATCGAGDLPRMTEATFDGGVPAFVAAAARGGVAVVWNGKRARLVEGCHLDGQYTEALGQTPGARFFATNRVLFRADEIGPPCRPATHAVAAYVTSIAVANKAAPSRLDAILVPLPCPSVTEREAAPGCVGAGLTGAERHDKAARLRAKLAAAPAGKEDVAAALEIFALVPDELQGLLRPAQTDECALAAQGRWVSDQYLLSDGPEGQTATLRSADRRPPPPHLRCDSGQYSCSTMPVFLTCFGDRFSPVFHGPGDWSCARGSRP
jgi:hypothetical protein